MSEQILVAIIAVPLDRASPPAFDRGHLMIDEVSDTSTFVFDDPETDLAALVDGFDPSVGLMPDGSPTVAVVRRAGHIIIDDLKQALESSGTCSVAVAGYRLYISGGVSAGDGTDAAEAIWNAGMLPGTVLQAMGFIVNYDRPLSRSNGGTGRVTDTDVVDALALGLGTKLDWSCHDLNWIADAIGTVRARPGDAKCSPEKYFTEFIDKFTFNPGNDDFLIGYVDEAVPVTGGNHDNNDERAG
ncbi:hypothetical protein [Amycolatopsis sp. PS_44_ISF1]|uniref:hypothetical protein n=1 Tax=Amycolatopsis sp. PS_44_ISF1 TaxID=2974917 RepID=UPI0028DE9407|nr:hypothetical protein [Amycolatopsis sp. PS_44_ISF1]MDT8913584.1 hypothetical protein [Amycolatopsis sp. PS_44_ISF1]